MPIRNSGRSIQKIVIHSSKVGNQNIDTISFMKVADMETDILHNPGRCSIGVRSKIKETVAKKKSKAKYSRLSCIGSHDGIEPNSKSNEKKVGKDNEQNALKVIKDVPNHTSTYKKKKANKLSPVSKPHLIKDLKVEIDDLSSAQNSNIQKRNNQKTDKSNNKMKICVQKNQEGSKKHKGKNLSNNVEGDKKYQGKNPKISSLKHNGEDTQPLISNVKVEDNEINLPADKSSSIKVKKENIIESKTTKNNVLKVDSTLKARKKKDKNVKQEGILRRSNRLSLLPVVSYKER